MPSELKKPMPFGYMGKTQVFSSAQLEQYAADRVREALERAAQAVLARARNARGSDFPDERDFANAVLALKEQTK